MAIFGKDSEEKWEKKYQKLEKSFSDFKNESRESEASLREAIQNVSFAAEGVNSEIDFQLKRINVQLDSRAESSHLCNTSRSILDKKKLYNKQNSEGLKSTITKLIEFSRGLPKAKEIAKEIKAIEKEIKTAEDSDVHKILHNLIQILKSGLAQQSELVDEEESSSWFSNIFSFGKKEIDLDPLMTILNYLIEHLKVPNYLENELESIREMIDSRTEKAVLGALDRASQLVIKIYQASELQFNNFLDSLNEQISLIEDILFNQQNQNNQQKDHTNNFSTEINNYASNLSNEVTNYNDLDSLKTHLSQSIGTMMQRVVQYNQEQMQIHEQQQVEISKLNEKIRETVLISRSLEEELSKTTLEALRDPLTNLPNRAAYDKRVVEEFERWKRYNHNLFIVVCDIDHFKKVNDTYGHQAGDKVLTKVGEKLLSSLRKIDFVGRYGGEEFVILIEKVSEQDVMAIADKLRTEIAGMGFHFNNTPINVTSSFGVSQFRPGDTFEAVFERADKALYTSKNKGRNQVNFL